MSASIIAFLRTNGPASIGRTAILLALMAWGGAAAPWLDGLNHFAPFWFALSALAALVCVLLGAKGWAAYCLVAAIAHAGILAPELVRPHQQEAIATGRTIRVVWLNTWLGQRPSESAIAYLENSGADFVLVSELPDDGQAEFQRLRALYPTVIRCADGRACNTIIFSKREAQSVQTVTGLRASAGEFDIDGRRLRLIAAHISRPNPPDRQQRELRNLLSVVGGNPSSVILAGDFNSTPWSFTLRRFDRENRLARHTRALPTWPAQAWTRLRLPAVAPFLPIDHMYSGSAWRLVELRRGPRTSSDHYPIEATFQAN